MYLNSTLHGGCPVPFYDASLFPHEGGYVDGRLCSSQLLIPGFPSCCLPCPATHWAYSDDFQTITTVAGWLNVVGLILQVFMLVSNAVLPQAKTRSNYLTQSLIITVIFINLAFVVPLGAEPELCYNEITPNDMYTSTTCAWSGAFLLAGALAGSFWIFIRAFAMYLTVVWDITPDTRFFYISQAVGWGVPAALLTAAMSISGVSFRFGSTCHINHDKSMMTFWGWLLAVAGSAVIIQISTFGYCIHVFLRNLWEDSTRPNTSRSAASFPTSTKSRRARTIYRRLRSVLVLQWRGIVIVTLVLVDVILFATVFVYLEKRLQTGRDYKSLIPLVSCLVKNGENRQPCLNMIHKRLISEATVGGMLIMVSLLGIQLFTLVFRWSVLAGWKERLTLRKQHEFVSLDARRGQFGPNPPKYELRKLDGRMQMNYTDKRSATSSIITDLEVPRPESGATFTFNSPCTRTGPTSIFDSPSRRYDSDSSSTTTRGGQPWGELPSPPLPPPPPPRPSHARNFSSLAVRTQHHDTLMIWDASNTYSDSMARQMTTPSLPPLDEYERSIPLPGRAL